MTTTSLPRIPTNTDMVKVIVAFNTAMEELDYQLGGFLDYRNISRFANFAVNKDDLKHQSGVVGISGAEPSNPEAIRFYAGDDIEGNPNFKVTQAGIMTAVAGAFLSAMGYPRVEVNSTTNLIGAYQTANESIRIDPAGTSGDPVISFYHGGSKMGSMQYLSPDILLFTANGVANITLSSGISLKLEATNDVRIACSFLKINGFTGQNASINYVKNVVAGAPTFGTMNFTNGILTSWT